MHRHHLRSFFPTEYPLFKPSRDLYIKNVEEFEFYHSLAMQLQEHLVEIAKIFIFNPLSSSLKASFGQIFYSLSHLDTYTLKI